MKTVSKESKPRCSLGWVQPLLVEEGGGGPYEISIEIYTFLKESLSTCLYVYVFICSNRKELITRQLKFGYLVIKLIPLLQ